METVSIALLCTVAGVIISYLTFQRNSEKDIKNSTTESTTVAVGYVWKL